MRKLIALLSVLAWALPTAAQDVYPSRPVRMVLPFPAGGPLDLLGRLAAQKLSEQWGNPVVVENIAGGTGSIGANAVARAAPDGYTLHVTVAITLTMSADIARTLPYTHETSFQPIDLLVRYR